MQCITLCDNITLSVSPANKNEYSLALKNPHRFAIPDDDTNSVVRAVKLFFQHASLPPHRVHIALEKNIPACAGLGGGSSNAATVLHALCQIFPRHAPKHINTLAHALGSDVPFFFSREKAAFVQGTGQNIMPISPLDMPYVLVVLPPMSSFSTQWAYTMWDAYCNTKKTVQRTYANDFQTLFLSSFFRERDAHRARFFEEMSSQFSRSPAIMHGLCGSGLAWYGVFETEIDMHIVQDFFHRQHYMCFTAKHQCEQS